MPPELLHFLLVEDDDDHAALVLRCFSKSRLGNTIDRVTDGVEALAYLRREGAFAQSPRPGAIVLDLNLPKLSGHELLSAIKSDPDLRKIPVVILTTSAAEIDRAKAYTAQAGQESPELAPHPDQRYQRWRMAGLRKHDP